MIEKRCLQHHDLQSVFVQYHSALLHTKFGNDSKDAWKILDVYNMKSYCRLLSLKVPRLQSYWFYLKALNRSDSYNLVMVNCLNGHGMIQSVICFLWLTGPSLHLWRLMMGIRRASSYYFMQRRLSTSCFFLIIQSWPCPWRCHVDIAGVQAFYTGGHSHEEDRHLRATIISPQ